MTTDTADQEKKPSIEQRLKEWLSHPLLLLLIGAVITGLLVPSITHGWQVQQMGQDTKAKTITDVADATTTAMTQLEISEFPQFRGGNTGVALASPAVASAYQAWTQKGATVRSEINAYFPENGLPTHWDNLYGLVRNFFLLTYSQDPGLRQRYISSLKHYFDVHKIGTGVDWRALGAWDPTSQAYRIAWTNLERGILHVRDALNQGIMDAPNPGF